MELKSARQWCHFFYLRTKEEELVNAKSLKLAESSTCTKFCAAIHGRSCYASVHEHMNFFFFFFWQHNNRHDFTVPHFTAYYCHKHSKLTWQVSPTRKQFSTLLETTNIVLWCYLLLTVEKVHVALNFSLGNMQVLSQLISLQIIYFTAAFTHAFTRTLATTWLDVQFIVLAGDPVFTTARIESQLQFFPLFIGKPIEACL